MKTKQLLAASVAFIALVSSCKKDDYRKLEKSNQSEVQFTSKIVGSQATKASGNSWDANDEIGVFMKQGSGLTNALAANKKYTTTGNGNFTATASDIINYPETGNVDFIAYYPFSATIEANSLAINVADQANQAKIDVMYSDNAKNLNKSSGPAKLEFVHRLAKIELTVKAGTGVNTLTGLTSAYQNIPTVASMDLGTGNLSGGTTPAIVNAKTTAQTAEQLVEAILIPGDYNGKEVVFTIGADKYKWTLPANTTYVSGTKYAYNIILQAGGLVAVEGSATITDWTSVTGGTHTIGKDGGTVTPPDPEGTEQTIYEESFGELDQEDRVRYRFANYTKFSSTVAKYSDLYTDSFADIRRTGTMDAHVWMPASRTTGFKIENLNTTGFTDLKLSFAMASNGSAQPIEAVKIKVNGQTLALTGTLGAQNVFSNHTISTGIPAAAITIEFDAAAADNKSGYRIDNIKLVGTK